MKLREANDPRVEGLGGRLEVSMLGKPWGLCARALGFHRRQIPGLV